MSYTVSSLPLSSTFIKSFFLEPWFQYAPFTKTRDTSFKLDFQGWHHEDKRTKKDFLAYTTCKMSIRPGVMGRIAGWPVRKRSAKHRSEVRGLLSESTSIRTRSMPLTDTTQTESEHKYAEVIKPLGLWMILHSLTGLARRQDPFHGRKDKIQ